MGVARREGSAKMSSSTSSSVAPGKDLYEFLVEAELAHYYQAFRTDLKVTTVPQIKYVEEEDLADMGMSRPEIRRLKKFFRKECPQGAFGKIRKILSVKGGEAGIMRRDGGDSPGEKSPQHSQRVASKHIISIESISVCKTLGTGEFGTVQQGIWTNEEGERIQVAVKKLSKEKMNAGTPDFLKEATIMHAIDHEHIVPLYGVVLDSDALMMVTELAPLRSLLECLKEPAMRNSFPVSLLCEFATQIADGMAYLETKRLIHRDLAARNVLVFSKDKVKISDFGLSRALGVGKDYYQTNFSVSLKLPLAWCAPECINYLKFTTASDVWAYGVTLWELFSYGFQPWAAFTGHQPGSDNAGETLDNWQIGQKILEAIDEPNFQRLEQPECCPREHFAIMSKCWEHDPKRRPTFVDIHRMLPQVKPEQVQMMADCCHGARADFLPYKASDIITVLDKKPSGAPSMSIWKGVLDSGKVGLFDSSDSAPYIEIKAASPMRSRIKLSRRDSSRKSMKSARKLRADMISRPQNDLRHTGHIGYDGAMFGDVAFIGNNYDKLPVKVVTPYKPQDDVVASSSSSSRDHHPPTDDLDKQKYGDSQSNLSIITTSTLTGGGASMMAPGQSQLSIASSQASDTFTDVSSYQGDDDSLYRSNGRASGGYDEMDDDLDSFKMPDFSSLDFGSSFMDEVMKAFSDVTDKDKTPTEESRPLPVEEKRQSAVISDKSNSYGTSTDPTNGIPTYDDYGLDDEEEEYTSSSLYKPYVSQERQPYHQDRGHSPDLDGSSRSSSSATLGSDSDDLPAEKRKIKPRLRIDDDDESIPTWDSKKHQEGIRPLSAKETKTMDEAIAVATELAQLSVQKSSGPNTPKTPITPKDKQNNNNNKFPKVSPKPSQQQQEIQKTDTLSSIKSALGIKKKTPPSSEGRVFSEELYKSNSVSNEDVSPEAQEVYNVLVGQGLQQERVDDGGTTLEYRRHVRDRRVRRSLEHQRHSGDLSSAAVDVEAAKERNQKLKNPQGIPGRGANQWSGGGGEVDVNPLRRLRDSSNTFTPRVPKLPTVDGHDRLPNGHNGIPPRSTSLDHIRRSNISQPHVMARLRDTDSDSEQYAPKTSHSADELASAAGSDSAYSKKQPPVPPRKPLRPGTINTKPRERKYPLDINGSNPDLDNHSETDQNSRPSSLHFPRDQSAPVEETQSHIKSYSHLPPFAVKNVMCSAKEMGIGDESDNFWAKEVDFESLSVDSINAPPQESGLIPIRYKSPDNVSYEDLMEFALDGSGEQNVCDEIRIMRKVLSKDGRAGRPTIKVTVEDCLMALEETKWNVHSAIKYLKLKQLLSTKLGDMEACKDALVRFSWCVPEAADSMLRNPPDQNSPDIVEL